MGQRPEVLHTFAAKSSNVPRRGGVRRLPATPAEPSLLNIDNLAPSHLVDQNFSTRTMLGVDLVNFPRLESSPTRMKLLMQSVGKLRGHVGAADTSVQVNLCQKLLFLHQLTHDLTVDCSWNY